MEMSGGGPLQGLRVVAFTSVAAAPVCAMMLADFGAEVIKVEPPTGDRSRGWGTGRFGADAEFSAIFLAFNRNQSSVVIDLRTEDGRTDAMRLLRTADVVIENFTPGVADEFGIGYREAAAVRPDIVYCSISGFGQDGPLREMQGFDTMMQAYTGHLSITGEPNRPAVRIGPSAIDVLTGSNAAFGIMVALHHRDRTGEGQYLETSLYDNALHLISHVIGDFTGTGELPGRWGPYYPYTAPYGIFKAADRELFIGVSAQFWPAFCVEAACQDLLDDPRFRTNRDRLVNRDALYAELVPVIALRPAADWVAGLSRAGIPASLVEDVAGVVSQAQARVRNMIIDTGVDGVRTVGLPVKLKGSPGGIRRHAPSLGEDTERILGPLRDGAASHDGGQPRVKEQKVREPSHD
jgi:crotonobetainyl-CoA:carnitine CoA-transferase CaiB-like acyl-CoA transferase